MAIEGMGSAIAQRQRFKGLTKGLKSTAPAPRGGSQVPKMEQDRILIDLHTCELTRSQFMEQVNGFIRAMPDFEIFLDGDAYALVARRRPSNNRH